MVQHVSIVFADEEQRLAMQIKGIDHVTVLITDAGRAIAFYQGALGLPEVSSPSTFPEAGLSVRWLKAGEQYIHLLIAPEADKPGRRHFALHVNDAKAARKHFESKGISIRETTPIPGAERFFISDPDGNRIEIIEWKDRSEIRPLK